MMDRSSTQLLAEVNAASRRWKMERCGFDYRGRTPCIPPLALAGMVDRILLRVRVEKDDAEERDGRSRGFVRLSDIPRKPAGIEIRRGTTKLLFPA